MRLNALRLPVPALAAALASIFAVGLLATPSHAAQKKGPPGILVIPTTEVGKVRGLFLRRVTKAVHDTIGFSNALHLLKDTDRAGKEEDAATIKPKETVKGRQIASADLARQAGTDLLMAKKYKIAYRKLRFAAKAYELAFSELVDFTKLADAYARSAVAAWYAKKGKREVAELFRLGLSLQPTLVIDRRGTNKKLLELFDGMRVSHEKAKRYAVQVKGNAPGVTVFVDGVKIGPLPARAPGLLPGTHYVQTRGPGWHNWAKSVRVRKRDASVKAKPKKIKVKAAKKVKIWSTEELTPCGLGGAFTAKGCRKRLRALAEQTGAEYIVLTALAADRYDRLTVHTFLMKVGKKMRVIALRPIGVAKNLGDLNARMTDMEKAVVAATKKFPKARALNRPPKVFR